MAHHLAELHAIALVDEEVADPPDEVEAELDLSAALDRPAPEHLAHDVPALDDVAACGDEHEEALPHHERRQQGQRER